MTLMTNQVQNFTNKTTTGTKEKKNPKCITSETPTPRSHRMPEQCRAEDGQWHLFVGSVPVHLDLLRLIHSTPSFLPLLIILYVSTFSVLWPSEHVAGS